MGQGTTMVAERGGGCGGVGTMRRPPRPRPLVPLLVAGALVYSLAAGYLVWRWTWDDPRPPRTQWVAPVELEPAFGPRVHPETLQTGPRSWATYEVGDDGRIVIETLHVTAPLPATGPPLPIRGMDDADRHARDLAFAQGEEAYERFREEQGWNDPSPPPPDRGEIHLDVEVGCLRVVVSSTGTPPPPSDALDDLEVLLAERLQGWLDDPMHAEHCSQLWGYP